MMKTDTSTQDATGVSTFHRLVWLLPSKPGARRRAFTRLELLVVLASLALFLACVALPALANNRQASERAICVNNLRQIGLGFQTWAMDNGELNPWRLTYPSGTANYPPAAVQIWVQYSWISNHLNSPKVLACPADPAATPAQDWTTKPNYGYLTLGNRATSYFLGLHSLNDYPQSILAGDRNLRADMIGGSCSIPISPVVSIARPYGNHSWADVMHDGSGNLLLTSGAVLQTSSSGLGPILTNSEPPYSQHHLHFPIRPGANVDLVQP